MSKTKADPKISTAMLVLRLSLALFLLPWVIEKFTKPEQTAKIFKMFYHITLPEFGPYIVGGIWALLLVAFVTGFKKRISYGLVLLLHGIGTIFTIPQLLPFLPTYNHLFLASIPVLGALIVLYSLREYDQKWAIS